MKLCLFCCVIFTDEVYTNKEWFQFLRERWSTNFDSLEKYYMKIKIRYNETGEHLMKYEHYPNHYRYVKDFSVEENY